MKIEDERTRFKRYQKACEVMLFSRELLREAYDFYAPGLTNFDHRTQGSDREDRLFSSFPPWAIGQFANTVINTLMPPFQTWSEFNPGSLINTVAGQMIDEISVTETLQKNNEALYDLIHKSNIQTEAKRSTVDAGISTGVVLLNEGDSDHPFIFTSVPISSVCFEGDAKGEIQNVWRLRKVKAREILHEWPKAELPSDISHQINQRPDEELNLIEGTIFYPDNPIDKQYMYYIQIEKDQKDIFVEFRDYNPWTVFRWNVRTGEILGYGPALVALADTKVLNKVTEFELKAGSMIAAPIMMATDSEAFNPYMVRLDPGSIIPISGMAMSSGVDPIRPISNTGDLKFIQIKAEQLREAIGKILLVNPIPPEGLPGQTATAISIVQNNWVKEYNTEIGRFNNEFIKPIVLKCLKIALKKGLLPSKEFRVDGKVIKIEFTSPLAKIQDMEDLQKIEQYMQAMIGVYGPGAAFIVANPVQLVETVAKKIGVDASILPSAEMLQEALVGLQQQANQNQQAQQQQAANDQNQQQNVVGGQ